MTVWETVLVFGVLPVAGLALLAALVFAPGAARTPRYRAGRPWDFDPVWYIARPDVSAPAGSAEGRAALAALSGPPAVEGGGASIAAGSVPTDTARGGANGEW